MIREVHSWLIQEACFSVVYMLQASSWSVLIWFESVSFRISSMYSIISSGLIVFAKKGIILKTWKSKFFFWKWVFAVQPVIPVNLLILKFLIEFLRRGRHKRILSVQSFTYTRDCNIISKRVSIILICEDSFKSFHQTLLLDSTKLYDSKIVIIDFESPKVLFFYVLHGLDRTDRAFLSVFVFFKIFISSDTVSIFKSRRENAELCFLSVFKLSIERNRFRRFVAIR